MSDRKLIALTEVKAEPQNWLWRDRIPLKAVTSVEGDAGDGKSTLMYDIAARLTTGRPMPFSHEIIGPAGVVILQAEDHLKETVRPVLDAAGADVDRIYVYDRTGFHKEPLILSKDLELIRDAIKSVGAKLVVVDPFTAFSGHSLNSETAVRRTLSDLTTLAEEEDIAIVLVRHLAKQRSVNPKHGGLGSVGFVAAVRSALIVLADPTSSSPHQHILATSKNNLSDPAPLTYRTVKRNDAITVEWLSECCQSVAEIFSLGSDRYDHSQLEEACFVLYSTLAEHEEPMPAKQIKQKAAEALVSERTLKRAKRRLGVRSRRQVSRDEATEEQIVQWVWELPEDGPTLGPYKERLLREQEEDEGGPGGATTASPTEMPEEEIAVVPTVLEPTVSEEQTEESCDDPVLEYEPAGRPWDGWE